MSPTPVPTLSELEAAAARVAANVFRTPLVRLPVEGAPAPVYAKAENLQRTGSFKLRGASNFLARLAPEVRARGVVTHSSGNHAQGVACAAALAGVPATIVIPDGAPEIKVRRTLAWGAHVVRCANDKASREGTAERLAADLGATLVPPYDHPWIVEGQASVGLEIAHDLPDVANVLVCVGGGGLLAGVASALRALGVGANVVGVEPALAADAGASFRAGHLVAWSAEDVVRTVADGVRTQSLGVVNFDIIRATVDAFVDVSDEAILDGAAWMMREAHLTVEPTGALAFAAYRMLVAEGSPLLRPGPTVVILSGGNADGARLAELAVRPLG
ncbi:MAG: threonine/serine dehydratase [Trueperaceae bacterium]